MVINRRQPSKLASKLSRLFVRQFSKQLRVLLCLAGKHISSAFAAQLVVSIHLMCKAWRRASTSQQQQQAQVCAATQSKCVQVFPPRSLHQQFLRRPRLHAAQHSQRDLAGWHLDHVCTRVAGIVVSVSGCRSEYRCAGLIQSRMQRQAQRGWLILLCALQRTRRFRPSLTGILRVVYCSTSRDERGLDRSDESEVAVADVLRHPMLESDVLGVSATLRKYSQQLEHDVLRPDACRCCCLSAVDAWRRHLGLRLEAERRQGHGLLQHHCVLQPDAGDNGKSNTATV